MALRCRGFLHSIPARVPEIRHRQGPAEGKTFARFGIGTLTKAFTALPVFQLHALGKLHLDAPVEKNVTDYAAVRFGPYADTGQPVQMEFTDEEKRRFFL